MGYWKLDVDGVTKDFEDDYGFKVKSWPGTGHSPVINRSTNYALQDGALFTGQKMGVRAFTLIGAFYGATTLAAFHDQRQALIKALSSRTTRINTKPQKITITYTGGTVSKEIQVIYEGGLELAQFTPTFIENDVPIRFTAYNPQWDATSDAVANLNTDIGVDTVDLLGTAQYIDGIWQEWGDLSGTGGSYLKAITITNSGVIYVGGKFTTIGSVSAVNVAKYENGVWSALGGGMTGDQVDALAYDNTNNILYIGGRFTVVNGVNAENIAQLNTVTGVWTAVGTGFPEFAISVNALAYDTTNELLYIGGSFSATYSRIATWNGSTLAAVGTGLNGACLALEYDSANDLVYIGGAFTLAGGVAANKIASWNGTTYAALGSGFDANVNALKYDLTNSILYIGGEFEASGATPIFGVAKWQSSTISAVGAEFSSLDKVYALNIDDSGDVYAGGDFTVSGVDCLVKFAGVSWGGVGISIETPSGSPFVFAILSLETDLFIGGFFEEASYAGYTTIAYPGSEIAYPVFSITRSGGTSVILNSLQNLETGAVISFNYSMTDSEVLTVDFRPGQRAAISSLYGLKWDAIEDNSNVAGFFLQPGNASGTNDNIVALSITEAGSPTTTATLTYRTAYRSLD